MILSSIPRRFHRWVDDAGWQRPVLDQAAGLVRRGPRPVVDRARPPEPTAARTATVSVIVPCYCYGHFLQDSVGSALAQSGVEVEVIVVDDASPDHSGAVADALAAADERVTVVHNQQNLGHVLTFNRGYERASGEFVVRLDADDLLTPGSLSRAVALFDAFPSVGLVYGHPRHFTSAIPPQAQIGEVSWTVWSGHDWIRERCELGVNCITTPEAMVRGSVMREVGPLNTRLRFAQDMEMWLRVAAVADVGRVNGADQALHRDHDASMSSNEGAGILVDLVERRTAFSELIRQMGERLPDPQSLDRTWRTVLAEEALGHVAYEQARRRLSVDEAAAARRFAIETIGPDNATSTSRRIDAHLSAAPGRVPAAARVVRQRVKDELHYLRWSRTGI